MSVRSALVLSPDPYLAFLLERHPEGLAVTVGDGDMRVASILAAGTDIVVCEHDDTRLPELRRNLGSRVVTVVDAGTTTLDPHVIHRPLSAEEVQRAVEVPLRREPGLLDDPIRALARLYPWGLVLAGAVAIVALHLRPAETSLLLAAYGVTAYALARVRFRHGAWHLLDTLLAAGTAAASAGARGGFVVFSAVAATGLGLHTGTAFVVAGGFVIGLANALGTGGLDGLTDDPLVAIQTTLIFPLIALVAAAGSERARRGETGTQERLRSLLHELRVLASSDPSALRLSVVLRDALASVLQASGRARGVLLHEVAAELQVGATEGVDIDRARAINWPDRSDLPDQPVVTVERDTLPRALAERLDDQQVSLIALAGHDVTQGVVVVPGALSRKRRRAVEHAAKLAGSRIANARSFARLRTDTVDEERRRLASELHDSTAQVLAHVRLELELIAREDHAHAEELSRLSRVTGRAQSDLREVISGLRASVEDEGLVGSLRAYVADLRTSAGPVLRFSGDTTRAHPPELEREVFRIAQEAISNAVRHADADTVAIHLQSDDVGIALTVNDDGRGLPREGPRSGLGLSHMRERATRLGARFDLDSSPTGTRVTLRVPVSPDARRGRTDTRGGARA